MSVGWEFRSSLGLAGVPLAYHPMGGQQTGTDSAAQKTNVKAHLTPVSAAKAASNVDALMTEIQLPVNTHRDPNKITKNAFMQLGRLVTCGAVAAHSKAAQALTVADVIEYQGIGNDNLPGIVLMSLGGALLMVGEFFFFYTGDKNTSQARVTLMAMITKDILGAFMLGGWNADSIPLAVLTMIASYLCYRMVLVRLSSQGALTDIEIGDVRNRLVPQILVARTADQQKAIGLEREAYKKLEEMLEQERNSGNQEIVDQVCETLAQFATWRCPVALRAPLQGWFDRQMKDWFVNHWAMNAANGSAGDVITFDVSRDAPEALLRAPVFGLDKPNVLISKHPDDAADTYRVSATSVPTQVIDPEGKASWIRPGEIWQIGSHFKVVLSSLGSKDLFVELP